MMTKSTTTRACDSICCCPVSSNVGIQIFAHCVQRTFFFYQKKINSWNEWHFVGNKTEIVQHALKVQQISLLPKYIS
jgi:predicted adenine nucleotide alpha hydrolase (AANH) superfamily ATPase